MDLVKKFYYNLDADDLSKAQVLSFFNDATSLPNEFVRSDQTLTRHYFFRRNPHEVQGRPFISTALEESPEVGAGDIGARPDGGSFKLSYAGFTTGDLAYNISAANLQVALRALTAFLIVCTVSGEDGGPWFIDSGSAGATTEMTADSAALAPQSSGVNIYHTQVGNGSLHGRWEVMLSKALPVFQNTFTISPDPEVAISILVTGAADKDKTILVSWNEDCYDGAVYLNVTAGAFTRTIGPIPFNIAASDFLALLIKHPGIVSADNVTVVQQTDGFAYAITFIGTNGLSNTPVISEESNTLKSLIYYEGRLPVSTSGADELLGSAKFRDGLDFEVAIFVDSISQTVCSRSDTVFRKDLIGNNPTTNTVDQVYYTQAQVDALFFYLRPESGAINRNIKERIEEIISVKDFGAIGDGTHDDTANIQAALTALSAGGGGIVFLPPGTYKLTDAINVPVSGIRLTGAGVLATILRQTVSNKSAITFTTNVNSVAVEGIRCLGNGAGTHSAPGLITPASINNIDQFAIRDCSFEGFALGAQLQDVANATLENTGCYQNGTGGMRVLGNSNGIAYISCHWVENSGYGLRLSGGRGHEIFTGEFGGPAQTGGQMIIDGASKTIVHGMNMECFGGDGITHLIAATELTLYSVSMSDFTGGASPSYSLVTGANRTACYDCSLGLTMSGGVHIKQTSGFGATILVNGNPMKVAAYSGATLLGVYKTSALAPVTETQASGLSSYSETQSGIVYRRMDSDSAGVGVLENIYTPMRKSDGTYEAISLTPVRSANTWTLPQTFTQTLTAQNLVAVNAITAGGDIKLPNASYFYWLTGVSLKLNSTTSLAVRNNADSADADLTAAKLTLSNQLVLPKTVTAGGTTGARTIDKPTGTVNFAAAATTLVVTNALVTTSSIIIATLGTVDTTMKSVVAVAGSGSFTLTANAAATAETRVNFLVLN
jgi:pectate lyase-like protein